MSNLYRFLSDDQAASLHQFSLRCKAVWVVFKHCILKGQDCSVEEDYRDPSAWTIAIYPEGGEY